METKPYRIQSPEDIAKDYGGNKQKIAQAMQLGIVDPTAGVLAGMFIDKMRAGQMQEMVPQQTVAQQIMAPQPAAPQMPAGGLGATPQAAPQMAPQMPPQAAPSMDPSAMGAAPPQGMAEGGLYEAPYMKGGGLSELPVPDTMFDEQRDGSYGGGGLVAFREGSPGTLEEDFDAEFADRTPKGDVYYGYSASDPLANAAVIEKLFGKPQTKYTDEYEQQLLAERSPEALKKAKNRDLGLALMAIGSAVGSTPGGVLQGIIKGLGVGAPILAQSAKERKAEERELRKGLLDIEAGRNSAAAQRAAQLLQAQQMGISGAEAQKGREAAINLEGVRHQGDLEIARLKEAGENYRAGLRRTAGSGGGGGGSTGKPLSPTAAEKVMGRAEKQMAANLALMEKADKSGDLDTVDRARANYAAALNTYNRAAGDIRLPPIQGARAHLPNWMRRASQSVRPKPNPGGPQVQNGRIVSVQDIPPSR